MHEMDSLDRWSGCLRSVIPRRWPLRTQYAPPIRRLSDHCWMNQSSELVPIVVASTCSEVAPIYFHRGHSLLNRNPYLILTRWRLYEIVECLFLVSTVRKTWPPYQFKSERDPIFSYNTTTFKIIIIIIQWNKSKLVF